jgi:hypothetical protein
VKNPMWGLSVRWWWRRQFSINGKVWGLCDVCSVFVLCCVVLEENEWINCWWLIFLRIKGCVVFSCDRIGS